MFFLFSFVNKYNDNYININVKKSFLVTKLCGGRSDMIVNCHKPYRNYNKKIYIYDVKILQEIFHFWFNIIFIHTTSQDIIWFGKKKLWIKRMLNQVLSPTLRYFFDIFHYNWNFHRIQLKVKLNNGYIFENMVCTFIIYEHVGPIHFLLPTFQAKKLKNVHSLYFNCICFFYKYMYIKKKSL